MRGLRIFLIGGLITLCSLPALAVPQSGDEVLAFVRAKLPTDPIRLTGSLRVRTKNGYTRTNLPVVMELNWGREPATATYRIEQETLNIEWRDEVPAYTFSNEKNTPTSDILGTGITWADLSFSVLWWTDSKLIGEDQKINRDCYVVEVPVPDSDHIMRLWIEKQMGLLLEAETFDSKKQLLRRLKIRSIKKMDGLWVAKDIEIRDRTNGSTTSLQISDLEWESSTPDEQENDEPLS
ncbi:MAG TPA: outer membrane lipoprotein-sorting protein [Pontiella sp.]